MRPSRTSAANGGLVQCSPGLTTSMWPLTISERPPPLPGSVATVIGRPSQWCQGGIIGWSRSSRGSGSHWSTLAPRSASTPPVNSCSAPSSLVRCSEPGARSTDTVSNRTRVAHELHEIVRALGDVGVQRADHAGVEVGTAHETSKSQLFSDFNDLGGVG